MSDMKFTFESIIFFAVLTLMISLYISYRIALRKLRVSILIIYILPVVLIFICIPLSWIPSALTAGVAIGWAVVYKLPSWIGLIAFNLTSSVMSLAAAWLISYSIMLLLNFLNTKSGAQYRNCE